jgi:hypothetical protein
MTPTDARARLHAARLAWAHALVFGALALVCYVSPETAFGDGAYLPLPRLSVLAFAAVLAALVLVLIASARSGTGRELKVALLAALVLDAQAPILMFSQTASLEYLEDNLGIPWFVVPLLFVVLAGATMHCLSRLRREIAPQPNEVTR